MNVFKIQCETAVGPLREIRGDNVNRLSFPVEKKLEVSGLARVVGLWDLSDAFLLLGFFPRWFWRPFWDVASSCNGVRETSINAYESDSHYCGIFASVPF